MNKDQKKSIVDKVRKIGADAVATSVEPPGGRYGRSIRLHETVFDGPNGEPRWVGPQSALIGKTVDDYNGVLHTLLETRGWNAKYSEEVLGRILKDMIREVVTGAEHSRTIESVERMDAAYESFHDTYTVLVPLINIIVPDHPIVFGRVRIAVVTDDDVAALNADLANHLRGTVCARLSFMAEPIRAIERAVEDTRRILDVLLYATPEIYSIANSLSPRALRPVTLRFGIRGDPVVTEGTAVHALDASGRSADHSLIPFGMPLTLDDHVLSEIGKLGAYEVIDILEKDNPTPFEKAILRAMRWFATAHMQTDAQSQVLSLTASMEAFLNPLDRRDITRRMAESAALILATDLGQRRHIRDLTEKLYDLRSSASHGADVTILADEVDDLMTMAFHLIRLMIVHRNQYR